MKLVQNLAIILLLTSVAGWVHGGECERAELMKGFNPSETKIFGIGVSNDKNKAKDLSYQDIVSQLRADVDSKMTVNETEKESTYNGAITVSSKIEKINGIKFFKEGKDSNTVCMAYVFDVAAAYTEAEGYMRALDKKLEDALDAQKKKDYIETIRKFNLAKLELEKNETNILRADIYKTYLKKIGKPFWERFKGIEVDLDKIYEEAKTKIIFYIDPFKKYDEVALEAEAMLGEKGFIAQVGGLKPKNGIEIVFKEAGVPRKTKTSLGFTVVYRFGVIIKDIFSGRVLGTNKSSVVQGFSSNENEDDALLSASKQMSLNLQDALKNALPGLIQD